MLFFRNIIDSTLKNIVSTGDPLGLAQSYVEGFRVYDSYTKSLDEIMRMDKGLIAENITYYFKNMEHQMPEDLFYMIHAFMIDGPAGEVKQLKEYYLNKMTKERKLWDKYVHLSSKILSVNNEVEQIARLSEYLWAIKKWLHKFSGL